VELSEDLLAHDRDRPLIDPYNVYQHLIDYWAETMRDDAYLIAADGWRAETRRIVETDKKGKEKDRGWTCDLVPKTLIVARYFPEEQAALDRLAADLETVTGQLTELEEEHSGEDAVFSGFDKINKANVLDRLDEIERSNEPQCKAGPANAEQDAGESELDEPAVLREWLRLAEARVKARKKLKDAEAALDADPHYPLLTQDEIKTLAVDDKWLAALAASVQGELDRVSQTLTGRIRQLAERYAAPLPRLTEEVETLAARVDEHLRTMGFDWR